MKLFDYLANTEPERAKKPHNLEMSTIVTADSTLFEAIFMLYDEIAQLEDIGYSWPQIYYAIFKKMQIENTWNPNWQVEQTSDYFYLIKSIARNAN